MSESEKTTIFSVSQAGRTPNTPFCRSPGTGEQRNDHFTILPERESRYNQRYLAAPGVATFIWHSAISLSPNITFADSRVMSKTSISTSTSV
ncbi:hypothetical protein CLV25_11725 [Acetobacteroides hydrogenigenes]|uniref:Uncharacterized protein n=1 Tax=Acetobacteroides hydrogenigenes TaxID=979970 RepID=A0A4V2RNA2_9BACT|nr:hypothetical protein CLV25_11725 [Acetobacteroides hydrogenigenes]